MLDKFQRMLNKIEKVNRKELKMVNLNTVQQYFEMEDLNKWLKFNAINEEQVRRANTFDKYLKNEIKKLYVPDYKLENV